MIKTALRTFLFTLLAIKSAQYVIGGFLFGDELALLWLTLAVSVLHFFLKSVLKLTGLPRQGPGFLLISFLITAVTLYVLTIFIPMFFVVPTTISKLIIFGYVLPSKQLTAQWSLVFSSLLITVVMWFFTWLCSSKK